MLVGTQEYPAQGVQPVAGLGEGAWPEFPEPPGTGATSDLCLKVLSHAQGPSGASPALPFSTAAAAMPLYGTHSNRRKRGRQVRRRATGRRVSRTCTPGESLRRLAWVSRRLLPAGCGRWRLPRVWNVAPGPPPLVSACNDYRRAPRQRETVGKPECS